MKECRNSTAATACRRRFAILIGWPRRTSPADTRSCAPITLDADLDAGILPDLDRLHDPFKPDRTAIPDIAVELVPLSTYNELAAVRVPNTDLALDGGVA